MTCIRQVVTLLGYGEPQILEVSKSTLPRKFYWVLFPIKKLRQAVETKKRNTNQRKDRQTIGRTIFHYPIYEHFFFWFKLKIYIFIWWCLDNVIGFLLLCVNCGCNSYSKAGMEFTSCPRMLHGQSTGSTEIRTHD